jgi:hypothetical protein
MGLEDSTHPTRLGQETRGAFMDQEPLVAMRIEDGRRLIDRLVGEGIAVKAAGWVKESEGGPWYLYLVTPLVDEERATRPAYRRVNAVIRQIPQPFWVDPMEIKVVGPDSRVGKAMRDLNRSYPGASPIWHRGGSLGGLSIDGAYVYRSVPAPVG